MITKGCGIDQYHNDQTTESTLIHGFNQLMQP